MSKHKPIGVVSVGPFNAQVAIFGSLKSCRKYLKKLVGEAPEKPIMGAYGYTSQFVDSKGVVWHSIVLTQDASIKTLVHECSHAVDYLCDSHGVPLAVENTEIRAYMLATLVGDVAELYGLNFRETLGASTNGE